MFINSFVSNPRFIEILRAIDNFVNESIRSLESDFELKTLLLLILISFLYGIIHSIGPGHGKVLVTSFFLKEKHRLKKSMLMAAIVSIVHTSTAIILSLLFFFLLTGIRGMMRIRIQSYFMAASGVLIIIVGMVFLLAKIFKKQKPDKLPKSGNKNLLLVGFSAGIVPCPVSLMIMLLTLARGIAWIGLLSVFSISLGMFLLLSLIGFLSIKSRDGLISLSGRFMKKTEIVSHVIEYISIVLIIIIGFGMASTILLNLFG